MQLTLIGYVLVFIFQTESGLVIVGVLGIMLLAASWMSNIDDTCHQFLSCRWPDFIAGHDDGANIIGCVTPHCCALPSHGDVHDFRRSRTVNTVLSENDSTNRALQRVSITVLLATFAAFTDGISDPRDSDRHFDNLVPELERFTARTRSAPA